LIYSQIQVYLHRSLNKRLHEAQDEINNLKYLIDNFNKELNDVKVDGVLDNVTMDQFTELCDWLFDGLIVDVYTLSKISDSKTQLDNIKYQVENIMNKLSSIKN